MSGAALDLKEVRWARLKEIQYIKDKKVWRRIPRQEALRRGYKIVKGRGDSTNWKYRSGYVAKEFNTGDEDGFFASTPPLEALRLVISDAAKRDQEEDKVIMVNDVARAFFEAPARRTICVELPEEEETHEGDDVGLLLQSLYGTRDASANFQEEVRKVLTKAGLKRGKYKSSTYYHEKVGIKAMVHGDDFISSGSRKPLRWFRQVLETRFEVSTVVVGDGREKDEVNETKFLNRIIRMDLAGWHYEADQRHGEVMVKALNLLEAKSVQRGGGPRVLEQPGREPVSGAGGERQQPRFGPPGHPVRGQGDMQEDEQPARGDLRRLRRLGSCLVGRARSVWSFEFEDARGELTGFTDLDWAGCRKTATSTSGEAILRRRHTLRTWSARRSRVSGSGQDEL